MSDLPLSRPFIPDRREYGAGVASQIRWEAVELLLDASRYYWLSTTRKDGRPHAVPVWAVWLGGSLYFATSPESVTAQNLEANAHAVAHPDDPRDVVIVEGTAVPSESAALPDDVIPAYDAKYGWKLAPGDRGMPFYELRPDLVLAWNADDVRGTATRWRF